MLEAQKQRSEVERLVELLTAEQESDLLDLTNCDQGTNGKPGIVIHMAHMHRYQQELGNILGEHGAAAVITSARRQAGSW